MHRLLRLLLIGLALPGTTSGLAAEPLRPNVLLILADDLGYGDVSCYWPDSKLRTPHIDRLAQQGLRMLNAYTPASVCSPTRYGLLTGRYPWRTWHKEGVLYRFDPALIHAGRLTIGSLAQQQGYATGCYGKWHLGFDWAPRPGDPGDWSAGQMIRYADMRAIEARVDFTRPVLSGPNQVGFDDFFGTPHQGIDSVVVRNMRRIPGAVTRPDNHDDLFRAEAERFIRDHRRQQPEVPFLVYLPLGSPHHGRDVPARLRGTSADGVRGDRILWADETVGHMLALLDELEIADQTLVIFTSDNGGTENSRYPDGNAAHHPNGPWRGYKTDAWDGGSRVPLVVRWPGQVAPGSTAEQLVCLTDLLATLGEIFATPLPRWAGEDSFSMLSAWRGGSDRVRDELVLQSYTGVLSIRDSRWKLILGTEGSGGHAGVSPGSTGNTTGWDRIADISVGQLYDLEHDPYEQQNVFAAHPEVVTRLRARLEQIVLADRSRPLEP